MKRECAARWKRWPTAGIEAATEAFAILGRGCSDGVVRSRCWSVLHTMLSLAMVGWVSGVAPMVAQAAHGLEAATECCPDETASDDDGPCSPLCDDCQCSLGGRYIPEHRATALLCSPVASEIASTSLLDPEFQAPASGFVDRLLRPPRA